MGFLDRLHKVATGFGGALKAPVGLVADLATAPWRDEDDFDGFVNTIYRRTVKRGGDFFAEAIGPEEGLGAVIGAVPAALRNPARAAITPVLDTAETVYREGVAEPLAGAVTAASLMDSPLYQRELAGRGLVDRARQTQFDADAIVQTRSLGQSVALAFTDDVWDDTEVAKFVGTDTYDIVSGVFDAATRLVLDPTVVVGGGAMAGRSALLVKPIQSADDINKALKSGRIARFNDELEGLGAAEIRDQFFPKHKHGAVISAVLAEAGDQPTRMKALAAMMGDLDAIEDIRSSRAALAGKVERLTKERSGIGADDTLFGDPVAAERLTAEIDELYPLEQRLARAEAAAVTMAEVPRYSRSGDLRTTVTRSEFYQQSPLAAPVRVAFNMNPQRMVRLHDQSGDIQLDRMLRKSGMERTQRDALRGEYMAALNPVQRQDVLARAEATAVESLAKQAGMTVDEVEGVLQHAAAGRARASEVIQSRVYDGEGRSRIRFKDEGGTVNEIHVPLLATQEANFMPLADMDAIRKATTQIGQWRSRHPGADIPGELLDKFYKIWKPSVLLRVGWPLRVVGDEQMRIIAKLGALSQMKELGSAAGHAATQIVRQIPKEERINPNQRAFQVGNYEMQGAYGAPGDASNIHRELASSRASFEAIVGQTENRTLDKLREATGEWRSLGPEAPDYGPAWEKAVNLQIGQDQMARRLLQGEAPEQVADWMRTTPEGRAYAERNPVRSRDIDRWVNTVAEQVESYLPTDELKGLALRRKASTDDLVRVLPDASQRPVVHGEILAQALGKSTVDRIIGGIVQGGYKALGSVPSDTLSRNRFFSQVYKAEVKRQVDLLDQQVSARGRSFTDADLRRVEARAREYALGETKDLLYDLAESSELAEMVRFFAPFYSAWAEVLSRWMGLAVENPVFVARARMVAGSPEKASLDWFSVTDEEGNVITDEGPKYDTTDRFLTIRIPEWVTDMPGGRGLRSQGSVKFSKDAFNMVLQGPPGFGPVVQVPVNEIVKGRPQLEDSLKWVLPFGTTQEIREMLLPATAKRLRARASGEDDRIYTNTLARIYTTKIVDYNLGKRTDKPTYAEAKKETDAFFNLRMFASFVSPAAPGFDSPYQVYISAYRQLRTANPETADEIFLDTYGEEFFPLTASFSRSKDGVPPTLQGFEARKKYVDLIEKYPEMGGLIVGSEGAGDFARSVYDRQLATKLRPGSPYAQREAKSFEEIATDPQIRAGWLEYRKVMSLIEAERVQRGLPNLQVKAARDLAELKKGVTAALAEKYPEWYRGFSNVDRNAMKRRLSAMEEIVTDKRLMGRQDIQGLSEYLEARKAMQAELRQREFKTLTAGDNQDLALLWSSLTGAIVERNLAFQDLYYRYLERDEVAA